MHETLKLLENSILASKFSIDPETDVTSVECRLARPILGHQYTSKWLKRFY
jgi:hypothetical protein